MSVYIISNRSINPRTNRFYVKGKEKAEPTFRIAKIDDPKASKLTYTMMEDALPVNYKNVIDALDDNKPEDNLRGSSRMFYELYNDTICAIQDVRRTKTEKPVIKNDILFFIHGFSTGFNSSLEHIKDLHRLYVQDEDSPINHIIYLSWPSRSSKLFTYSGDQEDARDTGAILARVFRKTQNFFYEAFDVAQKRHCLGRIHLMCHSMGNQVLETFMQTIANETYLPIVTEILLIHADVQDNVFEEGQPFSYLHKISRRVHIYIHNGDDALRISRFTKNGTKRLGQRGPRELSVLNDETFIVDVSNDNEAITKYEDVIDHWGYLYRPKQIEDIIHVLRGKSEHRIESRMKDEYGRKNYFSINTQ